LNVQGKGMIPISDVVLGDILIGKGNYLSNTRVISVYRFSANGQQMVQIGPVEVSTNHFIEYNGKWIQAKEHPDAVPIQPWNGGLDRPLICLDTDTHKIPIDNFVFSDWDETCESDTKVMELAETILNAEKKQKQPTSKKSWLYQPALDGTLSIKMKDGTNKQVKDLVLGDAVSTGSITGLGKRTVHKVCKLPFESSKIFVTPSQLLWQKDAWYRAGDLYPVEYYTKELYTVVVMNSATIESSSGYMFRDMLEIHSPDMELPTMDALESMTVQV
jgi:hypothetical protein